MTRPLRNVCWALSYEGYWSALVHAGTNAANTSGETYTDANMTRFRELYLLQCLFKPAAGGNRRSISVFDLLTLGYCRILPTQMKPNAVYYTVNGP